MADGWESHFRNMGWQRTEPTSKTCFRCGEAGHIARRCPNFKDTRSCYNCGEQGHIFRDCTNKRRSKQNCFRCGKTGHIAKDCPNPEEEVKVCYKCHEEGHVSRDCPNRANRANAERRCLRCRLVGHFARDCPRYGEAPSIECYNCGERVHTCGECPHERTYIKREHTGESSIKYADEIKKIGNRCYKEKNYEEAVRCYTQAINWCPNCSVYYGNRSACYMMLNKLPEALKDAMESVRLDPNFVKGYLRVGKCNMELGDPTAAIMSYRKVLQIEPDNQDAKDGLQLAKGQNKTTRLFAIKEEGNREFRAGNLEEAYAIYTEALGIDPDNKLINAQLYCNRGTVCTVIGKKNQAIVDFTKAIELDTSYLKAYLRRAKSYMGMKKYKEAVQDYEKVCQMDNSSENKRLLQEAKSVLEKSKSKDYYKILGVSRYASDDDIRTAYKKQALSHHPDRHSHDTVEVQKEGERRFKEVGEAFAVLSNQTKRMRYNLDYDLEHPRVLHRT